MDLSAALFSILSSDSAVSGIVKHDNTQGISKMHIFPLLAPQTAALPFVVYDRVSCHPVNTLSGTTATKEARYLMDMNADTYSETIQLKNAVESALSAYRNTSGQPRIDMIHLDNTQDEVVEPDIGQLIGSYRITQDYIIWHTAD